MNLFQFINFLNSYALSKNFPSFENYPKTIGLNSEFLSILDQIKKFSKKDKVEFASTIYSFDFEIVALPIKRGYNSTVAVSNLLSLQYHPKDNTWSIKKIFNNGKLIKSSLVKLSEIANRHHILPITLIHSHPNESLFSQVDLSSFYKSNFFLFGLVSKETIFIAKTDNQKSKKLINSSNSIEEFKNQCNTYRIPLYIKTGAFIKRFE